MNIFQIELFFVNLLLINIINIFKLIIIEVAFVLVSIGEYILHKVYI